MEDPSHEFFFINRWLVHSQFMGIGNPLEVVVHHFLIEGMTSLGYWDVFNSHDVFTSAYRHWTRPMVSHDLRLSSSHDFTKLLHCVVF